MSEEIKGNSKTDQEIDLSIVIKNIWAQRKFVLKVTLIFFALGIFVAFVSVKEYTSSITMIVSESHNSTEGLKGLAAMVGVNLSNFNNNDNNLPISTYPTFLSSGPFVKELMQTKVKFKDIPEPITLYEYFSDERLQPFNFLEKLYKYTIRLPQLIAYKISNEKIDETPFKKDSVKKDDYLKFTALETSVANTLRRKIMLETKKEEGIIVLTANMPEAFVSAQVVQITKDLLQKYITEFKVQKAKQNIECITEQYNQVKNRFENKQQELARFRDANQNALLSITQTQEEQLKSEYNLLFSIYSELAKQLEHAKIKMNETQPILTVVDPALVPLKKSKPNRPSIVFIYTLLGLTISIGYILIPYLHFKKSKRKDE
jgi:uncharacterized protein involved in exopolysaccharide biosynthesis